MTPAIPSETTGNSVPSAQAWTWRRAQAVSGLLLAGFVGVHLINLPLAIFPGAYDAYQRILRSLYQSPLFEIPFVFTPLLVHIAAGIRGMTQRKRAAPASWPARLHRYSAWYLLAVIAGHVTATRGASLFYDIHPESAGLAFALAWMPLFFWPYYIVLALSGVAHLGYGLPRALSVFRRVSDRSGGSRALGLCLVFAALLAVLGILGLGGLLYTIEDPFQSDYAGIFRDMHSPVMPEVPVSQESETTMGSSASP